MKLLSLFDGSGGFPLAGAMCGIEPVMASEVEPYPIAVTKSRFPNMKHLGDVSEINGAEIEPVDIVCFGAPCQDVSVAGTRSGVKHKDHGDEETTRSGLFFEAIRIIREMRSATNGKYPTFAIYENVMGALNSNNGEDWRTVLEEFVKIVEPTASLPTVGKGKWAYADAIVGDGWAIAYRTLNAEYFGVPQRRRRVFVVASFRDGKSPIEILFERKGLRGNIAEIGKQGKTTSRNSKNSTITTDSKVGIVPYTLKVRQGCAGGGKGALVQVDKASTLKATNDMTLFQPVVIMDRAIFNQGKNAKYKFYAEVGGASPTIVAKGPGAVCCPMSVEQQDVGYVVRRLTPLECCRLQGFPDGWAEIDCKDAMTDKEYGFWLEVRTTYAKINGKQVKEWTKPQILSWYNKLHTDSAEYKMWGNGVALPCVLYIMREIARRGDEVSE